MPRYFFHIYKDIAHLDEQGQELPDVAAAHEIALLSVRALASEEVVQGKLSLSHRIEVADAEGVVIYRVSLRNAVEVAD